MASIGKATIVAALITAAGGIIAALIALFGNPGEGPPTPRIVTPDKPAITCREIPPVEWQNVMPEDGKVWVQPEWNWVVDKFEFTPGHWERERADYGEYIMGHWDISTGNCVWIPGAFKGQAQNSTIDQIDHRTPSAP